MKKISLLFLLSLLFVSCADSDGQGNSPEQEKEQKDVQKSLSSEEIAVLQTSSEDIKKALEGNSSKNAFFEKDKLKNFYSERDFHPAWEQEELRKSLFSALSSVEEEGLTFSDYHGEEIKEFWDQKLKSEEAARLDMLLSDAFLQYAHDLYFGKLDPKKLYKTWGVKRQEKDLVALLENSLENGKIAEAFEGLKPQQQIYRDLKTALSEFKSQKDQGLLSEKISEGKLIKPGEKSDRIPAIAARLQEKGFMLSKMTKNDSLYSETIESAVREFQKERGLQTDGIIGNSTIKELNMSPAERHHQILVNLERWRWYPRDLGEDYILVNVANFKLAVVKDGDTIREHKVVAGSRSNQTPTFSDTLQYIVINPQWHLPSSIARKEVIPKLRKDPSYLRNHNMKVFSGGKRIDASNIDWSSPEAKNYRLVQSAGPSNPLGRVKLIYPNKYLIYLHDTPAQSLFSQNQRAASHGCVRVEDAVKLAAYALHGQEDWDEERIKEVIDSGETTEVKIHRPIQVHHFYWTAWRDGGKIVFAPDVYELDKEVYAELSN